MRSAGGTLRIGGRMQLDKSQAVALRGLHVVGKPPEYIGEKCDRDHSTYIQAHLKLLDT